MSQRTQERVRQVREAVRGYLRTFPYAADTIVGIRQWWLPEGLRDSSMESIELALAELVAANEVRSSTLPDGTELYSRAPAFD
jgi:hypothetical protein